MTPTPSQTHTDGKPQQISLQRIFAERGGAFRRMPRFLVRFLERLVRQKELNDILRTAYPKQGWEFAHAALDYLNVDVEVSGEENIPATSRVIFASNHPLGGLDGIALIAYLGKRYGNANFRFLVNDLLMNVAPLQCVFLPINKFGAQGRDAAREIAAVYASDCAVAIFPAGLVSRMGRAGIRDLTWRKAFVSKALATDRPIVPVFFEGLNSRRFYRVAKWRKRLGIKVNLEQTLLPGELCAARGSRFHIHFGTPIYPTELRSMGADHASIAAAVRARVYALGESASRR